MRNQSSPLPDCVPPNSRAENHIGSLTCRRMQALVEQTVPRAFGLARDVLLLTLPAQKRTALRGHIETSSHRNVVERWLGEEPARAAPIPPAWAASVRTADLLTLPARRCTPVVLGHTICRSHREGWRKGDDRSGRDTTIVAVKRGCLRKHHFASTFDTTITLRPASIFDNAIAQLRFDTRLRYAAEDHPAGRAHLLLPKVP